MIHLKWWFFKYRNNSNFIIHLITKINSFEKYREKSKMAEDPPSPQLTQYNNNMGVLSPTQNQGSPEHRRVRDVHRSFASEERVLDNLVDAVPTLEGACLRVGGLLFFPVSYRLVESFLLLTHTHTHTRTYIYIYMHTNAHHVHLLSQSCILIPPPV